MGIVSEEYEGRRFLDFHLKYSALTQNLRPTIQEGVNEVFLCKFSKMSRWIEITSAPTQPV